MKRLRLVAIVGGFAFAAGVWLALEFVDRLLGGDGPIVGGMAASEPVAWPSSIFWSGDPPTLTGTTVQVVPFEPDEPGGGWER